MVERYDTDLAGIAACFIAGIGIGLVTGVAIEASIAVGATVSTLFMYDALLRNPPIPPTDPRTVATAVVWHAFLLVALVAALTA